MSDKMIVLPTVGSAQQKVKCKDCGFLTYKPYGNSEFHEAVREYRDGDPDAVQILPDAVITAIPICFVHNYDLKAESENMRNEKFGNAYSNTDEAKIESKNKLVTRERECTSFISWRQGFTPKEHAEWQHNAMLVRIAEERKLADEERDVIRHREERERQEKQREADLERQALQREADLERQALQRKDDLERQDKRDRRDLIIKIGMPVLTIVAGAVGYVISKLPVEAWINHWTK